MTKAQEDKKKALLAKALGKDVKDVQLTPEPKEKEKAPEKKSKSKGLDMEQYHNVKLPERVESDEENDEEGEIEIVEVKPVKGKKKVIAQNSEQATKLLSKKEAAEKAAANQKELEESIAADQARTAKKEEEEAAAIALKEKRQAISAKALAAKRAKKEAKEAEELAEARACVEEQENAEPENKFELMCPHAKHGLVFGTDAEEYDVCDKCPLLKECIAKRDEVVPVKRVRNTTPKAAEVLPEGMTGAELKRAKKAEKKAAKAAAKKEGGNARTRTNKPADAPKMTRSQVIGMVMKDDSELEGDEVIEMADALFLDLTGVESNIAQTKKYYTFAVNFLKGYNA